MPVSSSPGPGSGPAGGADKAPTFQTSPANWLDSLLFARVFQLIRIVRRIDYIGDLHLLLGRAETAKAASELLGRAWKAEKLAKQRTQERPSLTHTLYRCFGWRYGVLALWKMAWAFCVWFCAFYLMRQLLVYSDSQWAPGATPMSKGFGFGYAGAIFACCVLASITFHNLSAQCTRIGIQCRAALVTMIYRKALKLSYVGGIGDVINLISNDCNRVAEACVNWHFLWSAGVETVIIVALALAEAPSSAIASALIILLVLLPVQYVIARRASAISYLATASITKRVALMSEILTTIRLVKFYALESYFQEKIGRARSAEMRRMHKALRLKIYNFALIFVAPVITTLATYVSYYLIHGQVMPSVSLFTIVSLFNTLRYPLLMLPNAVRTIAGAQISLQRLEDYFMQSDVDPLPAVEPPSEAGVLLQIAGGAFTMEGAENVYLRDVDVTVRAGEIVAIVGDIDAGKALLFALMGQVKRHSGQVRLHGTLAYVPADAWLIQATVRDNILFGSPLDAERFAHVLQLCGLDRDVAALSEGDLTYVNDLTLTDGQRARIVLARSLYWDPDILVFEDPLTQFSTQHARELFNSCIRAHKLRGKTVVLHTQHRRFLADCDRILFVKGDRIAVEGSYAEVRRQAASFFDLAEDSASEAGESGSLGRESADSSSRSSFSSGSPEPEPILEPVGLAMHSRGASGAVTFHESVARHTRGRSSRSARLSPDAGIVSDPEGPPSPDGAVGLHSKRASSCPPVRRGPGGSGQSLSAAGRAPNAAVSPRFSFDTTSDDEDEDEDGRRAGSGRRGLGSGAAAGSSQHARGGSTRTLLSPRSAARSGAPQSAFASTPLLPSGAGSRSGAALFKGNPRTGSSGPSLDAGKSSALGRRSGSQPSAGQGHSAGNSEAAASQIAAQSAEQPVGQTQQQGQPQTPQVLPMATTATFFNHQETVHSAYGATTALAAGMTVGRGLRSVGGATTGDGQEFQQLTEGSAWEEGAKARVRVPLLSAYKRYIREGSGVRWVVAIFASFCVAHAGRYMADVWLSWSTYEPTPLFGLPGEVYVGVYGGIVGLVSIGVLTRGMLFSWVVLSKSRGLHNRALKCILRAPLSYFDVTPLGQILSTFAKHLYLIDDFLPEALLQVLSFGPIVVGSVVLASVYLPHFWATLPAYAVLLYLVIKPSSEAEQRLKLLEASSKAPLFSHFSTTLEGVHSIRIFHAQDRFESFFRATVDADHKALCALMLVRNFHGLYIDLVTSLMILVACLFTVIFNVQASVTGLTITNVMQLLLFLQWFVRMAHDTHASIDGLRQLLSFTKAIPAEAPDINKDHRAPAGWPSQGAIETRDLTMRYHRYAAAALKRVSLRIAPREKVGVVGRNGAGKTSLIMALLRVVEYSGTITIDDVDIKEIGLRDLRRHLGIVPMDPILLTGTIRSNLDPFHAHADDHVWRVLERVHLSSKVRDTWGKLDAPVLEHGRSFTLAERRLLAIARALLQETTVVIIDEPTTSMDRETDELIQRIILDCFADRTVVIMATQLDSVMSCDRLVVFESGRLAESGAPLQLLDDADSHLNRLVHSMNHAADVPAATALLRQLAVKAIQRTEKKGAVGDRRRTSMLVQASNVAVPPPSLQELFTNRGSNSGDASGPGANSGPADS